MKHAITIEFTGNDDKQALYKVLMEVIYRTPRSISLLDIEDIFAEVVAAERDWEELDADSE